MEVRGGAHLPSAGPRGWEFLTWGLIPLLLGDHLCACDLSAASGPLPSGFGSQPCLCPAHPSCCDIFLSIWLRTIHSARFQVLFRVCFIIFSCLSAWVSGSELRSLLLHHLLTTVKGWLLRSWGRWLLLLME